MRLHIAVSPAPGEHPALWALRHACGLSDASVSRLARVPVSALHRAASGYAVDHDHVRRLAALLERYRDATIDAPAERELPAEFREYRAALFAVVNAVIVEYSRPPPSPPSRARNTTLWIDLMAAIGRGTRRAEVLAALRPSYRPHVVRRAARLRGVVEEVRSDGVWWLLPPDAPIPLFPPPTPTPRQPRSQVTRRVHDFVSRQFRAADTVLATDVYAAGRDAGFTQSQLRRAAREMCLVVETRGFGADKRSTWSIRGSRDDA